MLSLQIVYLFTINGLIWSIYLLESEHNRLHSNVDALKMLYLRIFVQEDRCREIGVIYLINR